MITMLFFCLVIAVHLALLKTPISIIRDTAMQTIKALHLITSQDKKCFWNVILLKILNSEEEVLLDSGYIKRFVLMFV